MRILVFVIIMLISACASSGPDRLQGDNSKAGQGAVYKHLDADPDFILPDGFQCRVDSTLVCSVGQDQSDCQCKLITDMENRNVRMPGRGARGAGRRSRGYH